MDYENGDFSDREKAALRYADQMWLDHHDVTDEHMDALREQFDEEEIVELSWAIGEFISLGKLVYVFGIPYGSGGDATAAHATAAHATADHAKEAHRA